MKAIKAIPMRSSSDGNGEPETPGMIGARGEKDSLWLLSQRSARKVLGTLSLLAVTLSLLILPPATAAPLLPLIAVAWFDYRFKLVPKDVVGSIAIGIALLDFHPSPLDLVSFLLLGLFLLLLMTEREREAYKEVVRLELSLQLRTGSRKDPAKRHP